MAQIKISILNDSDLLTDGQVAACVTAWQRQITEDFAPAWGIDADLIFRAKGEAPVAGSWWLSFVDDSAKAVQLGIHDTTQFGQPVGKVFVKADNDANLKWSVTASHELLEMLVDPDVNRTVFVQTGAATGKFYTLEVCDAVEDDAESYPLEGVSVSNFVLPAYFRDVKSARIFDHRGSLKAPAPALCAGGYLSEFDVTGGAGWKQNSADTMAGAHRGQVRDVAGSRADRRLRPRSQWKASDTRLRPAPSG